MGPPSRVKGEFGSNDCAVPESIPAPEFFSTTVLVALALCAAVNNTFAGIESLPPRTTATTWTITFGCFGSPLAIWRNCLAVPQLAGLKRITIEMLEAGA